MLNGGTGVAGLASVPCRKNWALLVAWLFLPNQVFWRRLSLCKDVCHPCLGAFALQMYQQKGGQLRERCFPG